MKFTAENSKWDTEMLDAFFNQKLTNRLKEFAKEYNHCFQPHCIGDMRKYAIIYFQNDLKFVGYVGEDVYSDIWFDDAAVARLAIELYKYDLIRYFQYKKLPKKMTVEEIEKALGYKVEIVSE